MNKARSQKTGDGLRETVFAIYHLPSTTYRSYFLFLVSYFLPLASDLWACAVCFGEGNSNLARGFYWGILLLIFLPFVLFGIIGTKIFLAYRKNISQENSTPVD